ncbi:MAG: membrane protein insertase YidC [Armatimonadetes bacterium]|nr:membrane protein insertase YidC [Armatimonadota bacterium]
MKSKRSSFLMVYMVALCGLLFFQMNQQKAALQRQEQEKAAAAAKAAGPVKPAPKPVPLVRTAADPVFFDDLLLSDPALAGKDPAVQRDALRQRLNTLPKGADAAERKANDIQAARLHLTIGYLYDRRLSATDPEALKEGAGEYALVGRSVGHYKYAGQAHLRAAEIYLAIAARSATAQKPLGDPAYVKKARRELDALSMAFFKLQHQRDAIPLEIWHKEGARWVPVADPYGCVLQRIDDITNRQFVYRMIDFLVHATGNFPGWSQALALLLLAIFLKLLTMPLSRKSYRSMAEMQKLQPHMQELQKRLKDNPQKLNEEMMKLYREHGVNPLAGCLPMFIQIPVFIFVYQGVRAYTWHFHNVPLLWVKSLAGPDLPLLLVYGASMFVTQKLTMKAQPPSADPNQQQMQRTMGYLMPVMFTYMMYQWGLPSAFYLYWLSFNILSTTEQVLTTRKMAERAAAAPVEPVALSAGRETVAGEAARRAGRVSAGKKRRRGGKAR